MNKRRLFSESLLRKWNPRNLQVNQALRPGSPPSTADAGQVCTLIKVKIYSQLAEQIPTWLPPELIFIVNHSFTTRTNLAVITWPSLPSRDVAGRIK